MATSLPVQKIYIQIHKNTYCFSLVLVDKLFSENNLLYEISSSLLISYSVHA